MISYLWRPPVGDPKLVKADLDLQKQQVNLTTF